MNESEAGETDRSRGNRENHGRNRRPRHYRKITELTNLTRRQFRQAANALTRRANELPRAQRRRSDTTGGGLSPTVLHSRPFEMPEAVWDDIEEFTETLDCMNPWHEPDGHFAYGGDFYIPDQADTYSHLEL